MCGVGYDRDGGVGYDHVWGAICAGFYTDANFLMGRVDALDTLSFAVDERRRASSSQQSSLDKTDHVVGPYQSAYWDAFSTVGLTDIGRRLRRRAEEHAEEKSGAGGKRNSDPPTDFRLTGDQATLIMRRYAVFGDVFRRGLGIEQGEHERELDKDELIILEAIELSILYIRQLSSMYSRYTIKLTSITRLIKLGHDFMALLSLLNFKVGGALFCFLTRRRVHT